MPDSNNGSKDKDILIDGIVFTPGKIDNFRGRGGLKQFYKVSVADLLTDKAVEELRKFTIEVDQILLPGAIEWMMARPQATGTESQERIRTSFEIFMRTRIRDANFDVQRGANRAIPDPKAQAEIDRLTRELAEEKAKREALEKAQLTSSETKANAEPEPEEPKQVNPETQPGETDEEKDLLAIDAQTDPEVKGDPEPTSNTKRGKR